MRTILVVSLGVLPVVVAHAAAEGDSAEQRKAIVKSLHWIKGPTKVTVGANAAFNVPEGYVFLEPADTTRMMEVLQNPPTPGETLFGPADLHWFALFDYEDTGHVPDDEKLDADSVLKSIKEGTEESNKQRVARGWGAVHVVGWKYVPFYEPATKRLTWAVDGRSDNGEVVNYNTRILGRTGVTSATLVVGSDELAQAVPEFNTTVGGYQYAADQTYAAFRPGDHVAEYGLAALIAGGGAAMAAKTGLLAKFWKLIVVGAAAFWKLILAGVAVLVATVRKIFGKNAKS